MGRNVFMEGAKKDGEEEPEEVPGPKQPKEILEDIKDEVPVVENLPKPVPEPLTPKEAMKRRLEEEKDFPHTAGEILRNIEKSPPADPQK